MYVYPCWAAAGPTMLFSEVGLSLMFIYQTAASEAFQC